jgi:dihydroorotase-like cyclic amidohydrolase
VSAPEAIETGDKDFVGKSPCDWAYHIMLHSEPPPEFAGQLAEAIQAGYPTLKIFTTNILPARSGRMIDFGDIWEAFQVLAKEGDFGVIHAEDNDIVMHMYAKLIREGRVGFEHLAEVHNQLSEDLSFRRVRCGSPKACPAPPLHDARPCRTGVAAIAEAREEPAGLRRDAAPVPQLFGRGLQTPQRPDLSHLSVAEIGGGPQGAVGRHRQRREPLARRSSAARSRTRRSATASTT